MSNLQLVGGCVFNAAIAMIILRLIYDPDSRRREYSFAFFALNTGLFFMLGLLQGINLSLGLGLSLFAMFRLLRYRTEPIPVRDMTFLFVLMSLPVLNAILITKENYLTLLLTNGLILTILYIAEKGWGRVYEQSKTITYERIDLIKPEHYDRLVADLRERTGLPVTRCEVGHIDLLRDVAELQVYYRLPTVPSRLSLMRIQNEQ